MRVAHLCRAKVQLLSSILPTFEATVEHASRLMEASEGFQEQKQCWTGIWVNAWVSILNINNGIK